MKRSKRKLLEPIIWKKNSISSALWMTMAFTIVLIIGAFVITSLIVNSKAQKDYQINESETMIKGAINSIQSNIDNYKDLSRLVMLNDQVIAYLRADRVDKGLSNDAKAGVWNVLNVCRNVDSVYVFRNDGSFMTTGKGIYDVDIEMIQSENWQRTILDERGSVVFGMNANGAIYKNNRTPMISITRAIYDIYTQKQTGILIMNISELLLERVVSGTGNGQLCILDKDGNYIAGNSSISQEINYRETRNVITHQYVKHSGKNKLISSYAFEDIPLIILCSSSSMSKAFPREMQLIMVGLFVTFIIAVILASYFVSRNLTGPILKLSSAMEHTKNRGWIEKIDVKMPDNEIGMLTDSYNSMIEYLNNLFTELIEKEKSVQKAEMSVLYEQIKPHFLYNSLETISFMALEGGAENVHDALETLGSFYRNFLSKGNKIIPLKREVSIIRDYLALQKLRYSEILEDCYDIAEDTLDCMIPKLILQPMVENSIYHGIRLKGEPGEIKIISFLKDDVLHIIVRDTGVGISEENIEKLLSNNEEEDYSKEIGNHSNFGLKGTINRIKYFCNSENVVKIRSELGEFTEIEIFIPQNGVRREE